MSLTQEEQPRGPLGNGKNPCPLRERQGGLLEPLEKNLSEQGPSAEELEPLRKGALWRHSERGDLGRQAVNLSSSWLVDLSEWEV